MKKLHTKIKFSMARLTSLSDGCVIHLKKINLMFKLVCVYREKNIQEGKKIKWRLKNAYLV